MVTTGKVWLVGAGPGDPDLITVRGLHVLSQADVVLHDALSHPALLQHCKSADLRDVGKRGGSYSPDQSWITRQLIELAQAGKRVVRLKGGDSFLFARGAEEATDLAAAGVEFEVVPGLSSPVGTSCYAGIPLTHRDFSSSVTFITGTDRSGAEWSEDAWKKLATATDTICVLMGMRRLAEITAAVVAGGRAATTPAAVIQWGARPEQRVVVGQLENIASLASAAGLANPAVIVIGEVVALREQLRWFDTKPLFGKRLLVPRAEEQAQETARSIRERGAEAVSLPAIEIKDPPDPARLCQAARDVGSYDICLFTSANGVHRFFATLQQEGLDSRAFRACKIGAIGVKTAHALTQYGVRADVVAKEFVGEALAAAVLDATGPGRVLIPRALVAREELPQLLRAAGCSVDVVAAYVTLPVSGDSAEELRETLTQGRVDYVLFTSSSTVTSLLNLLGSDGPRLLSHVKVASIGPITSATLAERGVGVDVTASTYTVDGLLEALEQDAQR